MEIVLITIADILKDSNYKLTQFSPDKVKFLEDNIIVREIKGKRNSLHKLFC